MAGADPYTGRFVAGFLVGEKIGEGGMGAVYLAMQTRLARQVAFKILPAALRDEEPRLLKRFLREAKAAARVSHTNVVQVYDAGADKEIHFIAMEYVPGVGLDELLGKYGYFTEAEAVHIAIQAARGLRAAAAQGIVHRDVKPGNLMISRDGVVKVADFGLARDISASSVITAQGHVMGTPAYMSPEQCMGRSVDERSDQYSLGITLFEMFTGRRPFISVSSLALLKLHLDAPIPDPLEFRPNLRPRIALAVQRMMAKSPKDRFTDFDVVVREFEAVRAELTDTPAPLPPPPPPTHAPTGPASTPTERLSDISESTLLRLVDAIPEAVRKMEVLKPKLARMTGGSAPEGEPLLVITKVHAGYGRNEALHGLDLVVGRGEIVTLIGANGAGKSTVLNTICGLVRATKGQILFEGKDITSSPASKIAGLGVVQVPEGRRLFPDMTVLENLEMGAYLRRDRHAVALDLHRVFALFPILKERLRQAAGSLSGGEQQMCAMARGLMAKPHILLLDEPSLGLAPLLVEQIFDIIRELNAQGTTILLVEQNARMALRVAQRAYVLETGNVRLEGLSRDTRGCA
jgi:branched-chain amino acid transport system ATP-binding protein